MVRNPAEVSTQFNCFNCFIDPCRYTKEKNYVFIRKIIHKISGILVYIIHSEYHLAKPAIHHSTSIEHGKFHFMVHRPYFSLTS